MPTDFDPRQLLEQIAAADRHTKVLQDIADKTSLQDAANAYAAALKTWREIALTDEDERVANLPHAAEAMASARCVLLWVAERGQPTPDEAIAERDARINTLVAEVADLRAEIEAGADADAAMQVLCKVVCDRDATIISVTKERDAAQEEIRDIKSRLTNWVYCNPITGEVTQGLRVGHVIDR